MAASLAQTIDAIILKKSIFSESNEIVTMYSRQLGKIRATARAVKKPESKLAFGLQELFYSKVEIVSAQKRLTIVGVKPINTFKNLRENIQTVRDAMYAVELIMKSTADEQPNEVLFDYFLKFLEHLDSKIAEHSCPNFFAWQVLALTGYKVQARDCAICGRALQQQTNLFFSNNKSGFICSDASTNCAKKSADAKLASLETYQVLSAAFASPEGFEAQDHAVDQIQPPQRKELQNLTNSFLEHILERDLKTARYLV